MIQINNLHKRFKDLHVLNGINIKVNDGEVVTIIGPSGSGKSTLLRCLNLFEIPDSGTIEIGAVKLNVEKYSRKEVHRLRQQTAMVFQNYNLFKNKTALQNVTESLIVTKNMEKQAAKEVGRNLLEQVGIADKENNYPATLSGGQQQRVSIARALAVNPHAILLDEPTSALDPELVGEVLQVIRSIAKKQKTMIIVTHEMSFAREVSDRVVFMEKGSIVEEGTPKQIFDYPQNPRTQQFLQKFDSKTVSVDEGGGEKI